MNIEPWLQLRIYFAGLDKKKTPKRPGKKAHDSALQNPDYSIKHNSNGDRILDKNLAKEKKIQ